MAVTKKSAVRIVTDTEYRHECAALGDQYLESSDGERWMRHPKDPSHISFLGPVYMPMRFCPMCAEDLRLEIELEARDA